MANKNCAFLLDILIGEMMLKDPPSILDYRRNPLCPILQIQSNAIPTVYIPFLSAESVSSHLGHIRNGHNFLPLEVEESYLNNGKFSFHCGKSCLFTTSSDASPTKDTLDISILNSFCFPPMKFGNCQNKFNTEGEIKGKLEFYNSKGIIVAYIGICITIKVLGHGVALHTDRLKNKNGHEMFQNYVLAENNKDERDGRNLNNIDTMQNNRRVSNNNVTSLKRKDLSFSKKNEKNNDNEQKSIKQNSLSQYECSYEPLKCKKEIESLGTSSKGLSSEEIALRLAELENDFHFIENNDNLQYYEPQEEEVHNHPPPITYNSSDKEGELEWNRKCYQLIYCEDGDSEESFMNKKSESFPSSSSSSFYVSEEMCVEKKKVAKVKPKTDESRKQNERQYKKTIKNKPRLKGWLRSTPLITQNTNLRQPQAKQTRTTLLRKTKTDPEMAKQMKLEIERQVKQKIKILDANLKSEMDGIKQKRLHRNKLFHERLSITSSKQNPFSEQSKTPIIPDLQNHNFIDSNQVISSGNMTLSPSLHNEKVIESKIQIQKLHQNDNNSIGKLSTDKYQGTFNKSDLSNVNQSDYDSTVKKNDSRQFDSILDNFDSPRVDKIYPSGSLESKVFIENFPEEVSIGESLLSDSEKQNYENYGVSNSSQVDSNGRKISDSLINYSREDSIQENYNSISNHSESITKSEPKQNSSRSSTNKLRDRKIYDSYRNLSNSMDSNLKHRDKSLGISKVRKENSSKISSQKSSSQKSSSNKSSSHKSHTISNMKNNTLPYSNVDWEIESQATDVSEDIPEENKNESLENSLQSNSSDRLSSSSDTVPSEGAITADDSSVDSHIRRSSSRTESVEEKSLTYENDWKQKMENSLSIDKDMNSVLSSSRSKSRQRFFSKYNSSNDNSIESPSSQANAKELYKRKSPLGIDDVDSSISDISARIAALLMPRKPKVVQSFKTESISSYMPSDIDESLSSLSDI